MRKSLIINILFAVAFLASCEKAPVVGAVDDGEIQFEASLPGTKVTSLDFENGDVVSLYAAEYVDGKAQPLQIGGNFINNEKLTYGGNGLWTAPEKLYWGTAPCDFYAVYPALNAPKDINSYLIEVATDQNAVPGSAVDPYEASDVLFAKTENVSKEGGKVKLAFRHMMAKVVVNLVKGPKFEGVFPEDAVVKILNTATTAELNIAEASLQKYAFSPHKTITMKKLAKDKFEAVVVPQNIEWLTSLIMVKMGGIVYDLEYSLSLRPSFVSTINLTLNTSPDQEKIEIEIDPEAGQWN